MLGIANWYVGAENSMVKSKNSNDMGKEWGTDDKGSWKNFWVDGYVLYLDCADVFTDICQNYKTVQFKDIQTLICQ